MTTCRRQSGSGAYARVERECRWAITNIYLRADEHSSLAGLGRRRGVILAGLEHDGGVAAPALPGAVDVSSDDRFSGGALATATDEDVSPLLVAVTSLVRQ